MFRHPKDHRTILVVVMIMMSRMLIWAFATSFHWYLWTLLIYSSLICAAIKHNQIHLSIFLNSKANLVLETILNFFTGSTCGSMTLVHIVNHHHAIDGKEDWGNTTVYKNANELLNLLKYALTTPVHFVRHKKAWLEKEPNPILKNKINFENRLLLAFYGCFFLIKPISTLYYIVLPNFIGQLMLISFNYCQHRFCEMGSDYNHSRNFTGNFLNICLFNAGFHTAHHLYPNKHWSEYPKIHTQLQPNIHPKYNENNFFTYFWQQILKYKTI